LPQLENESGGMRIPSKLLILLSYLIVESSLAIGEIVTHNFFIVKNVISNTLEVYKGMKGKQNDE